MRWQEKYKKKLVSAAEAAKAVKSGNLVVIPYRTNTKVIPQAIADRKFELHDVNILVGSPRIDPAIFAGAKESFNVIVPEEVNKNVVTLCLPFSASVLKPWTKNVKALIKRLT